jgi:hypothetical protein
MALVNVQAQVETFLQSILCNFRAAYIQLVQSVQLPDVSHTFVSYSRIPKVERPELPKAVQYDKSVVVNRNRFLASFHRRPIVRREIHGLHIIRS